MSNCVHLLLDPGHGGMVGAEYLTKGKRSPIVRPGLGVHEGEFNRDVCNRIIARCLWEGQPVINLVPEPENVPLKERLKRVRKAQRLFGESILVSVHANAAGKGCWHKARGAVIFTHKRKDTKSKILADCIHTDAVFYSRLDFRKQWHKTANFTILSNSCPSVLVECGFMTNKEDARLLASSEYREKWADAIFEGVRSYCVGC